MVVASGCQLGYNNHANYLRFLVQAMLGVTCGSSCMVVAVINCKHVWIGGFIARGHVFHVPHERWNNVGFMLSAEVSKLHDRGLPRASQHLISTQCTPLSEIQTPNIICHARLRCHFVCFVRYFLPSFTCRQTISESTTGCCTSSTERSSPCAQKKRR